MTTTIQKILAVAILTLAVIGGGGYYLYKQYTIPAKAYGSEYIIVSGSQQVTPVVSLQGISLAKYRKVSLMDDAGSYAPDLPESPLSSPGSVSSPGTLLPIASSGYSGRASKSSDSFYPSGGGASGLLAAGTGSGRKSSYGFSGGGSIAGASTASSQPSVPFAAPFSGGDHGGGDPGGDPGFFIPVGEGWWILLLSVGVYGLLKIIIRNHA